MCFYLDNYTLLVAGQFCTLHTYIRMYALMYVLIHVTKTTCLLFLMVTMPKIYTH